MAYAVTSDEVKLYYEEVGHGTPILFVHEFAGDHRSWEKQLRAFGKRYRCVAYAARGYRPSDVPSDPAAYSYLHVMKDAVAVLDHLQIERAHLIGLSMGGYTALQVALNHPGRVRSLVLAGTGSGSERWYTADFHKRSRDLAEFSRQLAEHDARGSAHMSRGFQGERPSLYDFETEIRKLTMPALIVVGEEDERCIEPGLFLKDTIAASGLAILPKTGHAVNLEEPDLFNQLVGDFLARADSGSWLPRDPRTAPKSSPKPPEPGNRMAVPLILSATKTG